jgi:hypothetical protein
MQHFGYKSRAIVFSSEDLSASVEGIQSLSSHPLSKIPRLRGELAEEGNSDAQKRYPQYGSKRFREPLLGADT